MQDRLTDSWTEGDILKLHSDIVTTFLDSTDDAGVDAAIEYAKFLKHKGLDNQNYLLFIDLLLHENEEVIYALLADGSVFNKFKKLQRTQFLVNACFELLKRFTPGKVYILTLETLLSVLKLHYYNAPVGYKLYPVTLDELNYIGKFLDPQNTQKEKMNRLILDILAEIGDLTSKDVDDHQIDRVGAHANKIRTAFLDNKSKLEQAVPAPFLKRDS